MCCMILATYGNHVNAQYLGIVSVMVRPQVGSEVKTRLLNHSNTVYAPVCPILPDF